MPHARVSTSLLLVVFVCLLTGMSCKELEQPFAPVAWDPSQPLLIFEVRSGKQETAQPVVEGKIDLDDLSRLLGITEELSLSGLRVVELRAGSAPADCVFQIEPSLDSPKRGRVVWRIPGKMAAESVRRFGLLVGASGLVPTTGVIVSETSEAISVENEFYRIVHPKRSNGGLPSQITFKGSGAVDKDLRFHDRLHSKEIGGYSLRHDAAPVVKVVASGPIRTTISVTAKYLSEKGKQPPSQPKATYYFSYAPNSPLIAVRAEVAQASGFNWNELHFLELYHKKPLFPNWALGDGAETDSFKDTDKSFSGRNWGVLFSPKDALGLIGPSSLLVHDGASKYGTYLHGPWIHGWSDIKWSSTAQLYVGPSEGSFKVVQAIAEAAKERLQVVARSPGLDDRFAGADATLSGLERHRGPKDPDVALHRWRLLGLKRQAQEGQQLCVVAKALEEQVALMRNATPKIPPSAFAGLCGEEEVRVTNGVVGIGVSSSKDGLWVSGVFNGLTDSELLSPKTGLALWEIEFRNSEGKSLVLLPSCKAMKHSFKSDTAADGSSTVLTISSFHGELEDEKDVVDVIATARMEKNSPFTSWRIKVANRSKKWGVWEVRFPQICPGGENGLAAYPSGWGVLKPVSGPPFNYGALYPSGSCAMQFGSFNAGESGLYYAAHDGLAATKKLAFSSDGAGTDMRMSLGQYPEGMGLPGKNYEQPYDVIIGVFKGDWFTAAKIYREWALKQKWCAKGRIADRPDVSPKIKNIVLWAMSGGEAEKTIPGLLDFQKRFGVPLATHWYNWHVIPFDHTYPEYFPPKPGFKEGVQRAKDAGILVMPYINGRLWDVEIPSFAREAVRYVTRDEKGKAYIEQYGSKRMLGPMCPWTKMWQEKVGEIVWRLIDDFGVSGVYTDQVAAAAPRFCMDASHGHPLGGGSWWVEGYDKMLAPMRTRIKSKYPDSFLTTESNAESYIQHYDAYLMCNSTQGNLIPMFSAVYSDMILTFGRYTFESDAQDENAFYMKEGELFIFGGQLGWLGYFPAAPKYKAQGDYLKALSETRERAQKWMALGEMLRPLEYKGEMPTIVGQWAVWRTKQRVELPAVMNSVWRAQDGTIGIALTNMSAKPVRAAFEFDAARYGLKSDRLAVSVVTGSGELGRVAAHAGQIFAHSEDMPPRSVRFLIVAPQ